MGQLIDDLLALSRLGRQELKRRPVNVAEVVRQSKEDLRANWEGRPFEFTLGDLSPCETDPSLLRQVFIDLLSNAIKYTRKQEKPRIEVGALKLAELRSRLKDADSARVPQQGYRTRSVTAPVKQKWRPV